MSELRAFDALTPSMMSTIPPASNAKESVLFTFASS
jgi:hypothetical protein